jgi:ubiquinone/menaquinone biosynthesis C-methylase UbiE
MNQPRPTHPAVPAAKPIAAGSLSWLVDDRPAEPAADPEAIKGCCAAAYGLDLLGLFLGDSYHPGGPTLTRRLAGATELRPGQEVLDLACGVGTTAGLLAQERGVKVTGVDLGTVQVDQARTRASRLGLDKLLRFEVGDAERLPVGDGRFDAVVCECAFCTFPDKRTAAAEITRVLRPGGRVGITDVWLEPDRLEPDLAGIAGRIACLADAQPITKTRDLFASYGFQITTTERHDQALADMIEQIRARLTAVKILGFPGLDSTILSRAITLAGKAADVVARGDAGYFLMVAARTP